MAISGAGSTGADKGALVDQPGCDADTVLNISSPQPPAADALVPTYGPRTLSQPWAKARRHFSAQDFTLNEDDTRTCPTGKILQPRERRPLPNGDLRVLYAAKMHDCRICEQAKDCLGRGASGEQPRRVTGVRRVGGWQVQVMPKGGQLPKLEPERQQDTKDMQVLQWGAGGGCRVRRELVVRLRRQQVSITKLRVEEVVEVQPQICTKAERAHRRRSWTSRLAGNACGAAAPRWLVAVPGI